MLEIISQFVILVVAVGIGWYLGIKSKQSAQSKPVNRYPQTLRYLFDAYDAPTLDSFVHSLEVNKETFQLHLSIANFYRKKGEFEKATAIHQNLLNHEALKAEHRNQLTYELAQDFMAAGWYDRAEGLFIKLVGIEQWRRQSVESLLEIYEHEKDWGMAREQLSKLELCKVPPFRQRMAHYCCELAERAIRRSDFNEADQLINDALTLEKKCVRATLQLARMKWQAGDADSALNQLQKVGRQNPAFLCETTALLGEICGARNDSALMIESLERIWSIQPSEKVLVSLVRYKSQYEGEREAVVFLQKVLADYPSLGAGQALLNLVIPKVNGQVREWMHLVKRVIETASKRKTQYCCDNCGFSGGQLYWQCPRCKKWDSVKPIAWGGI